MVGKDTLMELKSKGKAAGANLMQNVKCKIMNDE